MLQLPAEIDFKHLLIFPACIQAFHHINDIIVGTEIIQKGIILFQGKRKAPVRFFKAGLNTAVQAFPHGGIQPKLGYRRKKQDWNKKQEDAAALAKLQRQILQNASRSVKPGGKLIYCTCTFTQTENEDVVGWFLANNAAFHLTPLTLPKNMPGHSDEKSGMLRLWPQIHQTDGFFICAMEKIS